MTLHVRIDEHDAGSFQLSGYGWEEPTLAIPASVAAGPHRIDISAPADRAFSSMHYWSLH